MIQLKRFSVDPENALIQYKNECYVRFPLEGLDMGDYVSPINENEEYDRGSLDNGVYDLYAVINHSGGLNSGHYTAYVKPSHDSRPGLGKPVIDTLSYWFNVHFGLKYRFSVRLAAFQWSGGHAIRPKAIWKCPRETTASLHVVLSAQRCLRERLSAKVCHFGLRLCSYYRSDDQTKQEVNKCQSMSTI